MVSLFDYLFGNPLNFSDNPFFNGKYERKSISSLGDAQVSEDDDTYKYRFVLEDEADIDYVKVSVKDNTLKVDYEKETEHASSMYMFKRSIPEDADLTTMKAEVDGKELVITVKKKTPVVDEPKRVKDVPISFDD